MVTNDIGIGYTVADKKQLNSNQSNFFIIKIYTFHSFRVKEQAIHILGGKTR